MAKLALAALYICLMVFLANSDNQFRIVHNCLSAVLTMEENAHHFIVIGDEINNYKLNETVYGLRWPRTIVSAATIAQVVNQGKGVLLLFPDANSTNYELFLEALSTKNDFKYVGYTESVLTVFHLFEEFWKFKILDVIVLYRSKNNIITVFTYTPFTRRGCNTDTPVRINKWDDGLGRFEKDEYLFSRKRKVYDLHGCPVRASKQISEFDGGTFASNFSSSSISSQIFEYLERKMNFSGIIIDTGVQVDRYLLAYNNLSNGNVLLLNNNEVDVALGKFSTLMNYGPNVMGPLQQSMDCFTWAVPVKAGQTPSMWTTYIGEFDVYTWIVIAGLQFLATSFMYVLCNFKLNKTDEFSSYFNGLASMNFLLGFAVKTKPKRDSLRVFYTAMVLFCFVTNAAYQATMGSLVTVPPDSLDLKNTAELIETDIVLTGYPRMYYLLLASNKSSNIVQRVLEKFQTINPGEFRKAIRKVPETRKFAVFQRFDMLKKIQRTIKHLYKIPEVYYIIPDCLFTAFNAPFLLKSGSVLWEPFVKLGTRLLESGIIKKWEKQQETSEELQFLNSTSEEKSFRKYSMKQLTGGLIILACGYTLSIAVFTGEILIKGIKYTNVSSNNLVKQAPKKKVQFVR